MHAGSIYLSATLYFMRFLQEIAELSQNKVLHSKRKKLSTAHGVPKRSPISRQTLLNFSDRTRTGVFNVVWP